jgi:hypothetical protein
MSEGDQRGTRSFHGDPDLLAGGIAVVAGPFELDRMLPLDAMMNALQDAAALYQEARSKVLDAKGRLLPDAQQHLAVFKDRLQLLMDVAKTTSPYVHAKMATVDFQIQDNTRRMVIRAPELVETAKEWEEQNRKMGYLVDATPTKDKANTADGNVLLKSRRVVT